MAGAVDDVGQVVQHAVVAGEGTALATRFAVAIQVVTAHGKSPVIEVTGDVVITTGVFAQPMNQQYNAAQFLVAG